MHLLIPFASTLSDGLRHAMRELKLPHLAALLARLAPTARTGSDEYTLTPPHERAFADALGWQGDDGTLPWAARQAALDGIDTAGRAWGLLTPVHWHVGRDGISLADPQSLDLSAHESRAFFEAIRELFESEGWTMAWGAPDRWYTAHDSLDGLPCASLDRAIGRNIDLWVPEPTRGRLVRRLQNEVQMALYQQPANDARAEAGSLPVNSFWLSGCGRAQAEGDVGVLTIDDRLRAPGLNEDAAGWRAAWASLDAGPVATLLDRVKDRQPAVLTLCGERFAQRFEAAEAGGWWSRVTDRWRTPPSPLPALEAL